MDLSFSNFAFYTWLKDKKTKVETIGQFSKQVQSKKKKSYLAFWPKNLLISVSYFKNEDIDSEGLEENNSFLYT